MGNYVRVPEQDWKNICNSTRSKTGGTDLMKSGDISPAIDSIQTGGGGGASPEWFNDGNTHIWITVAEGRQSMMLGAYVNGTVTIDWGDGTEPNVLTGTRTNGTAKRTPIHEYAKAGDYIITLSVDGKIVLANNNAEKDPGLLGFTEESSYINASLRRAIRKIELGNGIESLAASAFCLHEALTSIVIPNDIIALRKESFRGCHSLANVTIYSGAKTIYNYTFYECYSLAKITIPSGVTSIETYAFGNCYGMTEYDFSACTSVPKLATTTAFYNINSDCKMLIPSALFDEWSTATNWATYASYMVAV